jgi:biopolymer transport protein ExbD
MSTGGGKPGSVQSEINVTPLIDVLLVLLIIFLVVMPIILKAEALTVPRKLDQTQEMPDPNASTLTIAITKELTYTYSDGSGDPAPIQLGEIRGKIGPKLDAMKGLDKVVFVDFDDAVPWNLVVSTMDTIRGIATDGDHDDVKVALKIREKKDTAAAPQ